MNLKKVIMDLTCKDINKYLNELIKQNYLIYYCVAELYAYCNVKEIRLTVKGQRKADFLMDTLNRHEQKYCKELSEWVKSKSFKQLWDIMKNSYPEWFK